MPRRAVSNSLTRSHLALCVIVTLAVLCGAASRAAAGPNLNARIALHLVPATAKNSCANPQALPPCDGIVTAGRTLPEPYYACVLVTNFSGGAAGFGLAGVQFGITYDGAPNQGVDIYAWNSCGSQQFTSGGWPDAGSGNIVTWDATHCQRSEPGGVGTGGGALVGYFYLGAYTPDVLRITPRPLDGVAKVSACNGAEDIVAGSGIPSVPSSLGEAAFSVGGVTPGHNPCIANPTNCSISGPGSAVVGALQTYTAPLAPAATWAWTVTGAGAIEGPANQPSVQVRANFGPDFTLGLVQSVSGFVTTCSSIIPIQPMCLVSGPLSVASGFTSTFSVIGNQSDANYIWTLTGNGSFVTPPSGSSVQVLAGAPGSFVVRVDVSSSAGSGDCARTVTVTPPNCLIDGPTSVWAGTIGNTYTATGGLGMAWSWSIAGNGTLVGSNHDSSVEVRAGSSTGPYTLTVVESRAAGSVTCNLTAYALLPYCNVLGPPTVEQGTSAQYTMQTGFTAPAYAWTVTGDAVTAGPTNAKVLQVVAGNSGAFRVTCVASTGGVDKTCFKDAAITIPTCTIHGADRLMEGFPLAEYLPDYDSPATAYHWSISGNGTIADTTPAGLCRVNVGDPGALTLTLEVTRPAGPPVTCSKVISVDPLACALSGPTTVTAGAPNVAYTVGKTLLDATYAWSIAGNGVLAGVTTGGTVAVTAGAAGAYQLSVTISRHGRTSTCTLPVTVAPGTGAPAGRQLQAKLLLHLLTPTTKAACGDAAARPACADAVTVGTETSGNRYYVYLLVGNAAAAAGVAGLDCGIDYNAATPRQGVEMLSWTLCASAEAPTANWPAAGSGNRIFWDPATICQHNEPGGPGTGVTATAGYFYLADYGDDRLRLTPHPESHAARVVDCAGGESIIEPRAGGHVFPLGYVDFRHHSDFGYNPCLAAPVNVQPTSWSAIKSMYQN